MTGRLGTVTLLLALSSLGAPRAEDRPTFKPLFDGESLAGWTSIESKPGNWRVVDELLTARGDGKGWLSTNRAYADFELKLEYRIGRGGNSGILIRAPHEGDPSFDGLEIQILDDDAPGHRDLRPEQYTGSVYGVVAATRGHARGPGEWNAMVVRAEGPRVVVELNGAKVVDADVSARREALPRHRGIDRRAGFVGLQSHESPVAFRGVAIREIRDAP